MNNSKSSNNFFLWVAIALIVSIVGILFYNLLKPEQINDLLSNSSSTVSEKCIECHRPSSDMSEWHSYERIGCVSCHLGNPDESDILAAHTDMINIPGNLSNSRQTCGAAGCHPGITERVEGSLMTSMSGVVNIQRFYFGESDTLDAHVHVKDLGHSAADSYSRNLCASCHLGREKLEYGPVSEKTRGGGCNACHLNYSDKAKNELENYREGEAQHFHPSLTLNITNDHCFGCHSRSGRISTSYEGWHESQLKSIPEIQSDQYRLLDDKRVFVKISEDVHHALGLECIDCHSGMEVMGDGRKYYHAEEAVRIRCQDCHFKEGAKTIKYEDLDYESTKIVDLRPILDDKMEFVVGSESNYPLVNVIKEKDDYYMIGKNNGIKHLLSPQNEACSRGDVHDDLSCSACHTAWAPQCIQCHVSYDPSQNSFDLLARQSVNGKWIEKGGHFLAETPSLGIMNKRQLDGSTKRKIETFIPGMIINTDPSAYPNASDKRNRFARLYAPIEAHTTRKESRDCKSCHLDPNALGYGRGQLNYDLKAKKWNFNALYPLKAEDQLPEDAWIGLFEEPVDVRTTRSNGRPFNPEEQKRILSVGICLQCHEDNSAIMKEALIDFEAIQKKAKTSLKCSFK